MRILRTFVLGITTLASACSHNAGHARSTAALTEKASKASGYFTAEETARLDEITKRARNCGDKFRACKKTKPEPVCKQEMDDCGQKIKLDYNL